ncbi:unnamed protein product [Microthlaspi erraticum]|uniref:Uncharacterized protein n=1 Tax=Microthlaspi erraticum TaxID=1685480 RepID=A0A6D2L152_9BRAS|nr:unnamed protein product [Microthlaspi erraticum]
MPLFSARSGVMKQFDAPESNKTWDSKPPTNKTGNSAPISDATHLPPLANSALKVRRTNPLHVPHISNRTAPSNPQPAAEQIPQPSAAPLPLEVLPEPLVEPLAENEPITASANPPLSHQDPEPEHHPNPEQPRSQTNTRIHTGLTRHGYRLGHRRSRHTRHHTLSRIRRSPQSRPRPPRPLALPPRASAPRPLAPRPLAPSISLMEPKRAH